MADMGSLEKMGRELKCPICLSLLKSAVSVSCNHIFCNDCLMESMKSSSSCPVCKVPFRRREIRPSPHMDNLVGILKSMEAATGTNVVSTQVTSAVEVADGLKPADSRKGPKRSKKSAVQKKKITSKKEANTTKPAVASASRPTKKSSFSTNKRIHVTPFPESETPVRPRKIMKPEEPTNNLNQDAQGKDKALASDKSEGISLSPFFWLREREDEVIGTVETLSEPLSLATPLRHNAPCYSDIKDSEDETPLNTTPNSKVGVPQIFDSEIFEWTQRPCSPELCSTPSKKQGKCKDILDHISETHDEEDIQLSCSFERLDHASNAAQLVHAKEIKQKRKKTQGRNSKKTKLPDHLKVSIKEADPNQQDSNSTKHLAAKSCEKNSTTENNTSSRRSKAFNNINLFPCSNYNSSETFLPQDGLETEAHDEQLSERYQRKGKNSQQKKSARKLGTTGMSTVETTETNYEPSSKRVRKMPNGANAEKIRVINGSRNETEAPVLHGFMRSCTQHKLLDGKSKKSKSIGEMNSQIGTSMKSNIGGSTSSILRGRCQSNEAIHVAPSVMDVSAKNNCAEGIQQIDCSVITNFGKLQACPVRNTFLKKCNGAVSKVCCAFCQSVDITEVSGEMVHYHNGKQVPTELSGGANVIHSHKNCTEWAPDVYFEDDSVFNLMAELTRSKRIKCACCGVKGAALGCFDKSCRKSFHFTCAKLIPECRWDNENFVMLCPLHQSSKLPNEISEPQKQSKRIIAPKCPSQVKSSQDCKNNWKWPSGSTQKWVLCCSALSAAEKGVVSEFAKLAGLPISTSWSPSVTHVIASTDLSGACKRTLKFLMAILNGKWIVSIDWVKACMDHMEPVDETKFEVATDVHGVTGGPRLGRHRVIKKQPKLFDGMRFYLHGDYTKSYRGFLQDLVIAAGGTVLHRKPVSRDQQKLLDDSSPVIVVYSLENQEKVKFDADQHRRQADDAQALACASGGKAATSAWIIDSVAACNLQPL
ncbi:protein BREAST CANCER SUSCEPTIBILITY 1 homolog [Lolium rigidum]|uniref:protein BREAST CANCER SUSCEPTIBILITY 1 homolog n=1 Tax=Lolium rigidum TaxID=89674 RepID=UPI001F5D6E95|nr:protein BREAST CANCER SUSCEPTIBILITY 1 homolog [Lolium rigidum]